MLAYLFFRFSIFAEREMVSRVEAEVISRVEIEVVNKNCSSSMCARSLVAWYVMVPLGQGY